VLNGPEKPLYGLAFDGRKVVTGGLDVDIRVWDAESRLVELWPR
jgi:hypothetical protein